VIFLAAGLDKKAKPVAKKIIQTAVTKSTKTPVKKSPKPPARSSNHLPKSSN